MNYARIYAQFIASRKLLPPTEYSETHHITPKSMGGGNEAENLIRLSPEDHFFAHLLLAKAYGGRHWYAVVRMGASRREGKRGWARRRAMYGAAKRRSAAETSARCKGRPGARGADNGMHDPAVITWVNVDTGARISATKADMWARHGGCRAHWTSASHGARKTMLGWTPFPERVSVRSKKGKSLKFIHADGRYFVGTQKDFCAFANVSIACASRVASGKVKSLSGWSAVFSNAA